MSDSTLVSGRLTIEPPLTWNQYRTHAITRDSALRFVEKVEKRDTDTGELTVRTAVAVEPNHDERGWGRGMEEELEFIAELVSAAGAKLVGYLFTDVNDVLGTRRWWVEHHHNGRNPQTGHITVFTVMSETAETVWPDGTAAYVLRPPAPGQFGWFYYLSGDGGQVFPEPATTSTLELGDKAQSGSGETVLVGRTPASGRSA